MKIYNIAIIAHVDHGKTTLIDQMLKQAGIFRSNEEVSERMMDSNELEKERGITISAKCTAIWIKDAKDELIKINIIDTPGHADFVGEVDRGLQMVDGVLLLVDSSEGVMPQTKAVLEKALKLKLKIITVVNKYDRQDSRVVEVIDEILELFMDLGADDDQLNFPILYAAGREGWCIQKTQDERKNLTPLFNCIMNYFHAADDDANGPFKMLVTLLGYDKFLGRLLIGRIRSGCATVNMPIHSINLKGEVIEASKLTKLNIFKGIERINAEKAYAGDIVAIAGLQASVADTISDTSVSEPLFANPVTPPTISITIGVNDSPLAGQDGSKLTSGMIKERLLLESQFNVAIKVEKAEVGDAFKVSGRGELQLGVLIETMRREGFELSVAKPKVILKKDERGGLLEPIEEAVVDVDNEYSGIVIDKLTGRKGELQDMQTGAKTRLVFHIPSRGLMGYHSEFLTDTKGTGVLNRLFYDYKPHKGQINYRKNGVLIATDKGQAVAYALFNLQDRGEMIIKPQDAVYQGMIVGIHSRPNDLDINVLKGKQLTNMRASGSDEAIKLVPPRQMSLEAMIAFIEDDELVEVTPKNLRMRKKYLSPVDRKRNKK